MKYEKWHTIITIVSLLIGFSNSYLYIRGCSTSEKLAHLHVEPNIKLYIEGKPPEGKVTVYNNGPINAVSFSASRIVILVPIGNSPYSGKISYGGKREYDPNNEIWKFVLHFNPKDNFQDRIIFYGYTSNIESHIAIHIFDLTYYRESDMKKYDRRVLFFDDGQKIMSHDKFKETPYYEKVMQCYAEHADRKSISEMYDRIRKHTTNIETE